VRAALFSKNKTFMAEEARRYMTSLAIRFIWIPFVNFLPFFPWFLAYYLYPDRKLRRFFPRLLRFAAAIFAARYLEIGIFLLFPSYILYYCFHLILIYGIGILICAVIFDDGKKAGHF